MKLKEILSSIAVIAILTLALITAGCDEGVNMAGDVLTGGSGAVIDDGGTGETPDPITTVGEVKKDPNPPGETVDPVQPDPEPEPEPEPVTPSPGLLRPEPEIGVTYKYFQGIAEAEILPADAWVLDFPGPYVEHTPPQSSPEDFVGQVCLSTTDANGADEWFKAGFLPPVTKAIVTITHGPRAGEQVVTNEGGYYHFPSVEGNELYLRVERQWLEPREVIASRDRPTSLQRLRANQMFDTEHHERESLGNTPGTILMGIRWPDAVRFILENESLPHDVLCLMGRTDGFIAGGYADHRVLIYNLPEEEGELFYNTLAHELAHARQHAVALLHGSSDIDHWDNTPEGKAYKAAWEKDLEEIPSNRWLGTLDKSDYYKSNMSENAAEFCGMYWRIKLGITGEESFLGGISKRAPNRYKWCQEHLATQYD